MARAFTPKVLVATDLLEGDAIWLGPTGWVRRFAEARLLDAETDAEAALASAKTQAHRLVDPYLADARAGEHGTEPLHFREEFRDRGPSNYHHGKQEAR